jgi:cytochrome P450
MSKTVCTSAWARRWARMEVNSIFTELLPRLKSIELNRNPELISTTFVEGLKHLPIRYELS